MDSHIWIPNQRHAILHVVHPCLYMFQIKGDMQLPLLQPLWTVTMMTSFLQRSTKLLLVIAVLVVRCYAKNLSLMLLHLPSLPVTLLNLHASLLLTSRCEPAIFNQFTKHLTMSQRRKISEMSFGGLLHISAGRLENSALLVFLMDKLNPDSISIDVGHENGLQINQMVVNKVLSIPYGDKDPPSSTEEDNERALDDFKKIVLVEPNNDVTRKHLLDLIRKLVLDDDLAVRIFFVVAFNKLLFPGSDNNIRGRDAFMTKHLSVFRDINCCKAVIDDLRQAALIWRSEKHKSIPGCALLLQIFYLDNLLCNSCVEHKLIPRARFFDNYTMKKIILGDKRKDKGGKETYGKLQLRNIASMCYQFFEPDTNESPAVARSTWSNTLPSIVGELGGLVTQIASTSSRNNAFEGMKLFDAKARQAIESVQRGSPMLVVAHSEFISAIRSILQSEIVEKRMKGHNTCVSSPTTNAFGKEQLSGSNEDSYIFRCGDSPAVQTDHQHPTTPSNDISMSNEDSHQNRCGVSPAVQTNQPHLTTPSNEKNHEPHNLRIHQGDDGIVQEELPSHPPVQTAHDGISWPIAPAMVSFAPDIDAVIRELSQAEKVQHAASDPTNHDHGQLSQNGDEDMPVVSIDNTIPPAPAHHVGGPNIQGVQEISQMAAHRLDNNVDPATEVTAISVTPEQDGQTGHDQLAKDKAVRNESRSVSETITESDASNVEKVVTKLTFASTKDESRYCIRARPTLHRIVFNAR